MMLVSVEHVPVTADEAITVLQAKGVCRGELPLLVLAQPYQFPVEAYLSAPGVGLVPRNTWGARYVSFIQGLLGFGLLLLLVRRAGPLRLTWPIMLLVMFPSAYLLMIQFGYSLPHNSPIYLATWGAMLLTVGVPWRRTLSGYARFILAGILCGLAFSNNMLALALIVPLLLTAVLQGEWRHMLPKLILLAAGAGLGLLPYLMALRLYPGAHASVAGNRSLGEALAALWEPGINVTLTRALGITPTLFPDTLPTLDFAAGLFRIAPFILIAVLLAATVLRATAVIRQLLREHTLGLNVLDVFIGVAWLNLALFAVSDRGYSGSYRYFAPAAWSFPFVLGAVYSSAGKWIRRLIGTACVSLAVLNGMTVVKLTAAWAQPDFAERVVDAPEVKPAIEFLRQQGIAHGVAYHWQCYRLNFYTDEKIVFSQPYNDRFRGWPLPYKDQVDLATNVAYVLSDLSSTEFNPARFEEHLKIMKISARKAVRGAFSIYYGFRQEGAGRPGEELIPAELLTVTTSHNPAEAGNLLDMRLPKWTTHHLQKAGMWVQLDFKELRRLSRILLIYGQYDHDKAPKLKIEVRSAGQWQQAGEHVEASIDPFEFKNGKPVYNLFSQSIALAPVVTDGLRLSIVEAAPELCWTFMSIELYERPESGGR